MIEKIAIETRDGNYEDIRKGGICFASNNGGPNYGKQMIRLFWPDNDETMVGYYFTLNGEEGINFSSFKDVVSYGSEERLLSTLGFDPSEYTKIPSESFFKKYDSLKSFKNTSPDHEPVITFDDQPSTRYDVSHADERIRTSSSPLSYTVEVYKTANYDRQEVRIENSKEPLIPAVAAKNPSIAKLMADYETLTKILSDTYGYIKEADKLYEKQEEKEAFLDARYKHIYELDERRSFINKSFETSITQQEAINAASEYEFPVDEPYSTSQDKAFAAMEQLTDDEAITVTLDRTSDNKEAEICGMTITDGKGNLLLDEEFRPKMDINEKYAKEHGLDLKAIKAARTIEEAYPEIEKIISSADCIIFHSQKDAELLQREMIRIQQDLKATNKDIKKTELAIKGVSCKKCLAAIAEEIVNYRQPVVTRFIRAIQAGFANRKAAAKEIKSLKEITNAHREHQAALYKDLRESHEKLAEIKDEKRRGAFLKSEGKTALKKGDKFWIPADKCSHQWMEMSRADRIIEEQLIKLYPQNIPSKSTWKPPRDADMTKHRVSVAEAYQIKQELMKKYKQQKERLTLSNDIRKGKRKER